MSILGWKGKITWVKGKTRCYKLDEAPEDRCSRDRHLVYLAEKRWGLDVTEESLVGISQNNEHEQGTEMKRSVILPCILESPVPFWIPATTNSCCFVCGAWVLLGILPNTPSHFRTKDLAWLMPAQLSPPNSYNPAPHPRTCSPANWLSQVLPASLPGFLDSWVNMGELLNLYWTSICWHTKQEKWYLPY